MSAGRDNPPSASDEPPARASVAGVVGVGRGMGGWVGIALVLLCLSVYLPGLWTIPPVDRDESRFAQASRQMWESGDWVVPHVQSKPRLNKPPLIYWCQCASIAIFGDRPGQYASGNIWVFRVPSVLAAIGSVLLTWRIGLRLMPPLAAALGAALLAVSPMVVWDAHQARADQLLLLCTTGAMLALLTSRERSERSSHSSPRSGLTCAIAFWLAISAGILTKGPITPMVVGLTALSLCIVSRQWRWLRDLRPALGVVILAAAVLPWVLAVMSRVGASNYLETVWDETLGRSAGAKEGHWGPPGYHLVLLTVLMWPGSLLTGWALLHGPRGSVGSGSAVRRFISDDPARRFLLCWIIPSWLVFELVSTKLPHYTMPLYPAIALLSAHAVVSATTTSIRDLGTRIGFAIWWLVGVAATLGLSTLVAITGVLGSPSQREGAGGRADVLASAGSTLAPYMLPGLLILVFLLAAGRSLVRGAYFRAQLQSIVAIVIWGATFLQFILPGAQRFWTSTRIAASAAKAGGGVDQPIFNQSSYTEDSLVFLTRGFLVEGGTPQRVEPAVLLVDGDKAAPPRDGEEFRLFETVEGWNYSNGREVRLHIVEHLPQRPPAEPAP